MPFRSTRSKILLILFFINAVRPFTVLDFIGEGPLGVDDDYDIRDLVAIENVRNKLSDSVRELVRFYEDVGDVNVTTFVQKYVSCTKLRDVRFFIIGSGEERFSAVNCSQWIDLFEMLRVNQVYLGDFLTNSAVSIIDRDRRGRPKELQTRSEAFIIGQYAVIPAECAAKGIRQLTPTNGTFVHKAQVTINWMQDIITPHKSEWKIVQYRQLLFQRWRWTNRFWSDEQFLFSGSEAPTCA